MICKETNVAAAILQSHKAEELVLLTLTDLFSLLLKPYAKYIYKCYKQCQMSNVKKKTNKQFNNKALVYAVRGPANRFICVLYNLITLF